MDAIIPPVALPLTANAVLVAVFAFFGFVLNIVPLTMLCRVRSLPAVTLITTVMVYVAWTFINACTWPTDDFESWWDGVGLCDIIATLRTPMFSLLALAVCVLTRDLSRAVDVDHPRLFESRVQRRRRIVLDVLSIFGLPIIQIPLHYVVQYNRYSIIPIYGCVDLLDDSWPKIVLLSMWPLLIGLLNCYYSILTIVRLRRHHGRLSSTLSHTSSGLDAGKFLKLFTLTVILLIIYLPVLGYFFYTNCRAGFGPYSYSRIHNPLFWNQIIYFHTVDYPETQYWSWFPIVFAYILFLWYGLTYEAIECYRRILVFCGLAKVWPNLQEPRQVHRFNSSNASSRQSRFGKVNIFSRTVSYFDNKSQASHDENVANSASRSEHSPISARKQSKSSTSTEPAAPDNTIPLAPIEYSAEKSGSPIMPIVHEAEHPLPERISHHRPVHRGLFSAFRTHIHVPYPLFSPTVAFPPSTRSSTTQARRTSTHKADLENQAHAANSNGTGFATANPVETNIWSGGDFEDPDPTAPKMGTRAYRERERREMMKRESAGKNEGRVNADDVHVRLGGAQQSGVEVKRELVQKEEDA